MLDADVNDVAFELIVEDLAKLGAPVDAGLRETLRSTAQTVGIDRETRALLVSLGCAD
jgi:hypothetical protein